MCNFRVSGRVKPGAKFQNLDFPEWMLQEFETQDVLFIQIFGNELIKKNIKISYKKGKKTIRVIYLFKNLLKTNIGG